MAQSPTWRRRRTVSAVTPLGQGSSGTSSAAPSSEGASGPRSAPGLDALLHPLPIVAVGVLLVNDHVLKSSFPGLISGKLSGIAVLVLLPFVLLAAWDVARSVWPRLPAIGPRLVIGAVVVTMASYVAIEVVPFAADVYRVGLGLAQWPFRALLAVLSGGSAPGVAPVQLWSDPTDLLVVPAALVVLVTGPFSQRRRQDG